MALVEGRGGACLRNGKSTRWPEGSQKQWCERRLEILGHIKGLGFCPKSNGKANNIVRCRYGMVTVFTCWR